MVIAISGYVHEPIALTIVIMIATSWCLQRPEQTEPEPEDEDGTEDQEPDAHYEVTDDEATGDQGAEQGAERGSSPRFLKDAPELSNVMDIAVVEGAAQETVKLSEAASARRCEAVTLLRTMSGIRFTRGKHNGQTYRWVLANDVSYYRWLSAQANRMDAAYRLFILYGELSASACAWPKP